MSNPFYPRPSTEEVGDSDPNAIHLSVGRALSSWEWAEGLFAHLFAHIIRPGTGSTAASRAYGSIVSPRSRKELIEGAAEVFFTLFPSEKIEKELSDVLKLYTNGGAIRNDIAHGLLIPNGEKGYFLSASLYTNKRDIALKSPYAYTSLQIDTFASEFQNLAGRADNLIKAIDLHFVSSPEKTRLRYLPRS